MHGSSVNGETVWRLAMFDQNVEKGFNDTELEDIMNEIESLEQEARTDTSENSSQKMNSGNNGQSPAPSKLAVDENEGLEMTPMENKDELLVKDSEEFQVDDSFLQEVDEGNNKVESQVLDDSIDTDEMEKAISQKLGIKPSNNISIADLGAVNLIVTTDLQKEIDRQVKATQKEEQSLSKADVKLPDVNKKTMDETDQEVVRSPTKMEFTVSGSMALHMCFHLSGKKINLKLDGSKGFIIELEGGAQFTFPLGNG